MMPLWITATRPSADQVRVGVAVGRAAVGGPPGVPDAGGAVADADRAGGAVVRVVGGPLGQHLLQVGQLAGLLLGQQLAVADDRDAGRVVAAVLQPPQSVEHDAERRARAGVTHDSTHGPQPNPASLTARARKPGKQSPNLSERSVTGGNRTTGRPHPTAWGCEGPGGTTVSRRPWNVPGTARSPASSLFRPRSDHVRRATSQRSPISAQRPDPAGVQRPVAPPSGPDVPASAGGQAPPVVRPPPSALAGRCRRGPDGRPEPGPSPDPARPVRGPAALGRPRPVARQSDDRRPAAGTAGPVPPARRPTLPASPRPPAGRDPTPGPAAGPARSRGPPAGPVPPLAPGGWPGWGSRAARRPARRLARHGTGNARRSARSRLAAAGLPAAFATPGIRRRAQRSSTGAGQVVGIVIAVVVVLVLGFCACLCGGSTLLGDIAPDSATDGPPTTAATTTTTPSRVGARHSRSRRPRPPPGRRTVRAGTP